MDQIQGKMRKMDQNEGKMDQNERKNRSNSYQNVPK